MTPSEFTAALDTIGWRQGMAGHKLNVSATYVGQMRRGERRVPEYVAEYVSRVLKAVESCGDVVYYCGERNEEK